MSISTTLDEDFEVQSASQSHTDLEISETILPYSPTESTTSDTPTLWGNANRSLSPTPSDSSSSFNPAFQFDPSTIPLDWESDDDSPFQLPSEDEDLQINTDFEKSVHFLAHQLVNFKGCGAEVHFDQTMAYRNQSKEEHKMCYSLQELGKSRMEFLEVDVLASNTLVSEDQFTANIYDASRALTGQLCEVSFDPVNLSLLKEAVAPKYLSTFFDIDSFIALPRSLAVASCGLRLNFYPNPALNLKATLHLKTPAIGKNGKIQNVSYHLIPHFCLGNLSGYSNFDIYIFFPSLYEEDRASNILTEHQLRRFVDKILLPSVYEVYPARVLQAIPGSYQQAKLNALASSTEARLRQTHSYGRMQTIRYTFPANQLNALWESILDKVYEPDFQDFGKPLLLINAKNMKVSTAKPNLAEAFQTFRSDLDRILDWNFLSVHQAWIDIGKEYVDKRSRHAALGNEVEESGATFLWRECCLKQFLKETRFGEENGCSAATYHYWLMTRDTGNLTLEPTRKSPFQSGGLAYIQMYSKTKEIFDSLKNYPFSNEGLEGLALDAKLRQAMQSAGRSSSWDRKAALSAYLASKQRVHTALTGAELKSYGVREEYRVTLKLAENTVERVDLLLDEQEVINFSSYHRPFLSHPTPNVCIFLRSHIGQYAYGFEYGLATAGSFIEPARAQVLTMFLRCLRFSVRCSLLEDQLPLWMDISNDGKFEGLAFKQSILKTGYCFLPWDKFDWSSWSFSKAHEGQMMFNRNLFQASFVKQWQAVQSTADSFSDISVVCRFFPQAFGNQQAEKALLGYLNTVLIKRYRRDFWVTLAGDMEEAEREEALTGLVAPTFSNVRRLTGIGARSTVALLQVSNRWKTEPLERFYGLWEYDDAVNRGSWEKKPYRLLYQHAIKSLTAVSPKSVKDWKHSFASAFLSHNWLLPSNTARSFWSYGRGPLKGKRLYYFASHPRMNLALTSEEDVVGPGIASSKYQRQLVEYQWDNFDLWKQCCNEGEYGSLDMQKLWFGTKTVKEFLEYFERIRQ